MGEEGGREDRWVDGWVDEKVDGYLGSQIHG